MPNEMINRLRLEALGFINNPDSSTPSQRQTAFKFLKQHGVKCH